MKSWKHINVEQRKSISSGVSRKDRIIQNNNEEIDNVRNREIEYKKLIIELRKNIIINSVFRKKFPENKL